MTPHALTRGAWKGATSSTMSNGEISFPVICATPIQDRCEKNSFYLSGTHPSITDSKGLSTRGSIQVPQSKDKSSRLITLPEEEVSIVIDGSVSNSLEEQKVGTEKLLSDSKLIYSNPMSFKLTKLESITARNISHGYDLGKRTDSFNAGAAPLFKLNETARNDVLMRYNQ